MSANAVLPTARTGKGQLKAWHALVWFLGFFGFMFVVNGIFLWTAITTFPGEDVEKSYLTGLGYNQEIARRERQAEEGWSAEIGLEGPATHQEIRIRMSKRDGSALSASAASLLMRHPADRALDRMLELAPLGGGEFSASVTDLAPGTWTVQFSADVDPQTDGDDFKAMREVRLP
ncbi:FixH family protein [Hyphomonas sp.]|jgi:nitrogen fixation protein FixH|uniref:FixH family protein n=1 Tax=Hyphomonas sp. TaxID=87 RepID=UPI0025BDB717|nr:FixH family protein [Hyphomonas sp.]